MSGGMPIGSSPAPARLWKWLPASLAAAATVGLVSFDLPPWLQKMATDWGPGFVILAGVAAGIVHYIPRSAVGDFIAAQKEQALAMTAISSTLKEISGQAGKIDEIKGLLEDSLINQRVMMAQIDKMQQIEVFQRRYATIL